jgi:hypothetical protein
MWIRLSGLPPASSFPPTQEYDSVAKPEDNLEDSMALRKQIELRHRQQRVPSSPPVDSAGS